MISKSDCSLPGTFCNLLVATIENMPKKIITVADIIMGTNSCFVNPKNWVWASTGNKSTNDGNSVVLSLPPPAPDTRTALLSYFLIEKPDLIFSEGTLTDLFK